MRSGRCFIVGAGAVTGRGLAPRPGDLLIAADGGYGKLLSLGLRPHAVVGDMDSQQGPVLGVPLLRFPVRKDDTDLALAIRLGRRMGFGCFRLYGVSGGEREDHFLAALQLMGGLAEQGLRLELVAPAYTIHALYNESRLMAARPGSTVSVFSNTTVSRGVCLRGLNYEADDLCLESGRPLGVSNEARASRILVGVKEGCLLVFIAHSDGGGTL